MPASLVREESIGRINLPRMAQLLDIDEYICQIVVEAVKSVAPAAIARFVRFNSSTTAVELTNKRWRNPHFSMRLMHVGIGWVEITPFPWRHIPSIVIASTVPRNARIPSPCTLTAVKGLSDSIQYMIYAQQEYHRTGQLP